MFNYTSEVEQNGESRTFVNTVTDLEGKVLVVEKTVATNGGRTVVSFEQDQNNSAPSANSRFETVKSISRSRKTERPKPMTKRFPMISS